MPGQVTQDSFGKTKDGREVKRYTLKNSSGGLAVKVIEYGCVITEIHVPDRDGNVADVTLGRDDIAGYESDPNLFGAIIGRVAGRISGAQFTLDGQTYKLTQNHGEHMLHGGKLGFQKQLWRGKVEGDRLVLTYVSADGEEGFPGELTTTVTYRVTDDNELVLETEATTTKPTPVDLTSHAYFNLAGHDAGHLDDHLLAVYSDSFLPLGDLYIPTGEIQKVEGTIWDLRKPVRLGEHIPRIPGGIGIHENYCLPTDDGKLRLAARAEHPPTGRYLECLTKEPQLQVYTSYFLNEPHGKGGAKYTKFSALCLEAHKYPDSVNQPNFTNAIVRPGETYRQTTVYKFGLL